MDERAVDTHAAPRAEAGAVGLAVTTGAESDPAAGAEGGAAPDCDRTSESSDDDVAQGPELTPEELAAIRARNAFIWAADRALTDVRQRSYEGKLTTTARWVKQAFAPEGTDSRTFARELVTYIEERDHAEAAPVMGRVAAPKPLSVQLEGVDRTDDDPLPELDVSDIAFLQGKQGTYLYSVALLSHSFARALFHTEEDDDLATFVDVVRTESSVYPRPVVISSFMNPPYLWPRSKTREVFEKVVASGSFTDIHMVTDSHGVPYYYSDFYLSEAQAASLAQWYGVDRARNP